MLDDAAKRFVDGWIDGKMKRDAELAEAIEEAGPYADPSIPMPTDSYEVGQWVGASAPRAALDNLLAITELNLAEPDPSQTPTQRLTAEGLRDNLKARIAYREKQGQ